MIYLKEFFKDNSNVLPTMIGMGVLQVAGFLSGIYIARGLGPELQGKYQLLISVIVFSSFFAKLGLDEAVAYLMPRYSITAPGKIKSLVIYSTLIIFLISIFFGLILYFFSDFLSLYFFKIPGFNYHLRQAIFLLPAIGFLFISLAILRGLEKNNYRAIIYYYIVSLTYLFLLLQSYYFQGLDIKHVYIWRFISYSVGALLSFLLIAKFLHNLGLQNLKINEISSIQKFGFTLIFVSIFQYLVEQPLIDLFIVGRIGTPNELGIYSVASRIASLVAIIPNSFTIIYGPFFTRLRSEGKEEKLKMQYKRTRKWISLIGVISTLIIFCSKDIFLGFFGKEYLAGQNFLLILLIGNLANCLFGLNTPLLISLGLQKIEFILLLIFCFGMLILGLVLGKWLGPLGVAIATSLSFFLLSFARFLYVNRTLKNGIR